MTDYGTDISALSDLDPSFTLVSGPHVVGEAVARRLITPRGSLANDANYGFDTRAYLNSTISDADIPLLASQIENEALKDERVQAVTASVAFDPRVGNIAIKLFITTSNGPFVANIAIGAVTTTMVIGV